MRVCIHAVCVSWFCSRVPPVHLESFLPLLLFLGPVNHLQTILAVTDDASIKLS